MVKNWVRGGKLVDFASKHKGNFAGRPFCSVCTVGRSSPMKSIFQFLICSVSVEPARCGAIVRKNSTGKRRLTAGSNCASGGLCGRLVLVSTAPENRHWLWGPRVSGGLGKCPRIERVLWRRCGPSGHDPNIARSFLQARKSVEQRATRWPFCTPLVQLG